MTLPSDVNEGINQALGARLHIPSESEISRAIRSQLPRAYENYPAWWPLLIDGSEYYIRGRQLVTLEEYQRNLALAVAGAA